MTALAGTAVADEDASTLEARRHFQLAEHLFEDARYDEAVVEYQKAYDARKHPNVLFNIAVAYERIYEPKLARDFYERFLGDPETTDEALKAKARARLGVLASLPGSIVVSTTPPGATATINGEGVSDRCRPTTCSFKKLGPGDYRIRVELADHKTVEFAQHLDPGEHLARTVPLEHETSTLTVLTIPEGARVSLDDKQEGVTPFSRSIETGVRRVLRVEGEGYLPYEEVLTIAPRKPVDRVIRQRRPARSTGRSELVIGGLGWGAFAGVGLAEFVGAGDNTFALLLAGVGGLGVGFLAAWLATDDGMKVGHASMMSGGTVWGTIIGASLSLGFGLSTSNGWAVTLLGGGLGLGVGYAASRWDDTSAGDAAVVNSGGTWGSLTGVLLAESLFASDRDYNRNFGFTTLGGCLLGLAAGTLFAQYVEVNRGHVAVVDVGGLAGLALGFGVGYLKGGNDGAQVGAEYGLGGMALGLLAAAILARNYKDDLPPTEALVARSPDGHWRMGVPSVTGLAGGTTARDVRLGLTLARGEF